MTIRLSEGEHRVNSSRDRVDTDSELLRLLASLLPTRCRNPREGTPFEFTVGLDSVLARCLAPFRVGQDPRKRVILQIDRENLIDPRRQCTVPDRDDRLDSAIEVPGHQVRRTDEVDRLPRCSTIVETVDT